MLSSTWMPAWHFHASVSYQNNVRLIQSSKAFFSESHLLTSVVPETLTKHIQGMKSSRYNTVVGVYLKPSQQILPCLHYSKSAPGSSSRSARFRNIFGQNVPTWRQSSCHNICSDRIHKWFAILPTQTALRESLNPMEQMKSCHHLIPYFKLFRQIYLDICLCPNIFPKLTFQYASLSYLMDVTQNLAFLVFSCGCWHFFCCILLQNWPLPGKSWWSNQINRL